MIPMPPPPEIRLIPPGLWDDQKFFNQKLEDEQILLMRTESQLRLLAKLTASPLKNKLASWLAIYLSHPQFSPDQLYVLARAAHLTSSEIFIAASALGKILSVEHLLRKEKLKAALLIPTYDFCAFRKSAKNGQLMMLRYLVEHAPNRLLPSMMAARDFEAFRSAARNGHLPCLHYLESLAQEQLPLMIAANDFYAYRWAAGNGHLHILQYLETKAGALLPRMMVAENFAAFRSAIAKNQVACALRLMTHPPILDYAEAGGTRYLFIVIAFIRSHLASLAAENEQFLRSAATGVFDVRDQKTALQCFYILRNHIRCRHFPWVRNSFLFLMEIPSVRALLHCEVSPGRPNELLRLAIQLNNREAISLLLSIPAVASRAAAENYYRNEQVNLAEIAANRESSMLCLSQSEEKRLEKLRSYYAEVLKTSSPVLILEELRSLLFARYQEKPALFISNTGVETALPFCWPAFQALALTDSERQAALKAYYQHPEHTASRYLSKPNRFMHPEASYVYISDDRRDRWSSFEDYIPLISLFYLAANDSSLGDYQGDSKDSRLEFFIQEIAYIGRSHNWDNRRPCLDAKGNPVLDAEGQVVSEEYDDLEPDRPSCPRGVKRRVFQSVRAHPCLSLTAEQVKSELRDFVREHFQGLIVDENRVILKSAWEAVIAAEDLSESQQCALKSLDINQAQQAEFFAYLVKKYGAVFSDDLYFCNLIKNAFLIQNPSDSHFLLFAHFELPGLLETPKNERHAQRFFTATSESNPMATTANKPCF